MRYLKHVSILFAFITCYSTAQNLSFNQTLDSIQKLRKLSNDENTDNVNKLIYAKKACDLSYEIKEDTTVMKSLRNLASIYSDYQDLTLCIKTNYKIKNLAEKLNDSSALARSQNILAWSFQISQTHIDSAYYYYHKALKFFTATNSLEDKLQILYNLSVIQRNEKDYLGAEINLSKILKELKNQPETNSNIDLKHSIFNDLGLINSSLKDYDLALEYYKKSLVINNKLPPLTTDKKSGQIYNKHLNIVFTQINIAQLYLKKRKFNKSISIYLKLLKDKSLFNKDPITYATILSNLAYVKSKVFNSNKKEIVPLFKRAYTISDSLNYQYEITAISNDLSDFYLSLGQKDSALIYLKKAYPIAKKINRNTEVLRSLNLLSKATSGEESNQYLQEYIKLSDSMIDVERSIRNKFARIQFETDEIIAQNKKITKDKKQISFLAFSFLIIALLTYIIYSQRLKNKELKFEQEQQRANEDVYSLMLSQQSKIETSKNDERKRISEELHDGILSKLFGTRIGLGFLATKLSGDTNSMEKFQDHIKNIQAVEFEVREISHELNNNKLNKKTDFKALIDHYLSTQADLHLFEYTLTVDKEIASRDISDRIKVELYRILQESLFNIIKHAQAEAVIVSFFIDQNHIVLSIQDDGIGFNTEKKSNGIGLNNINSRISKLDGELTINSIENKGTTVKVKIPIPD